MNKIYTLLSAFFFTSLAFSQAVFTVQAPSTNGATTQLRAPNGTTAHTSFRGVIIIQASELTSIANGTVISKVGFSYTAGAATAAGGTMTFFLENSSDASNLKSTDWATATSTMDNVFSGAYNLPVGTAAANVDIDLLTPFAYTGGSMYVAYEYSGTSFTTGAATYAANNVLGGSVKMATASTTTQPTTLTASSAFRPAMRLSFNNPNTNEMELIDLSLTNSKSNLFVSDSNSALAVVKNSSAGTLTNVPVTLNVLGANPYSATQTVQSIAAGETTILSFVGIPASSQGLDSLKLSVPADDVNSNNLIVALRQVSCDTIGVTKVGRPVTGSIGFNTASGILANRYQLPAGPALKVKKASTHIANNTASVGRTIMGVLCDSLGVIVDSSSLYTIAAGDLGKRIELVFINGGFDMSGKDFYIGFRQTANATGYFPLGTQSAAYGQPNRFYSLAPAGGDTTSYTTFGVFMIDAVLQSEVGLLSDAVNGQVCANTLVTFTASPGFSSYNFLVDNVSAQQSASSTFSHTPSGTQAFLVNAVKNGCSVSSPVLTISSLNAITNQITANICNGEFYQVGNSIYTLSGTYADTFANASVMGCDSIVHLILTVVQVDVNITQAGAVLTASQNGGSYQWINCATNQPVMNATGKSFQPASNGSYACVVSVGGCSDTTACMSVDYTGIEEQELLDNLMVYPNPTNDLITLNWKNVQMEKIRLLDVSGKVLFETSADQLDGTYQISMIELASGIYIVECTSLGAFGRKLVHKN